MAGDDFHIRVDQDRHVKPEGFNASRDLTDLLRTVLARVAQIKLQLRYFSVDDGDARDPFVSAYLCLLKTPKAAKSLKFWFGA